MACHGMLWPVISAIHQAFCADTQAATSGYAAEAEERNEFMHIAARQPEPDRTGGLVLSHLTCFSIGKARVSYRWQIKGKLGEFARDGADLCTGRTGASPQASSSRSPAGRHRGT